MNFENREYQNYIVNRINTLVNTKSVILELDCGMGKRVITYRLLTEIFKEEKVVVFLQTHSSLEETEYYLKKEYGGIKRLGVIKTGSNSKQRKYIIENNRVILALPISFNNTLKKYPELSELIEIVVINEIDTLVRRFSKRRVLTIPWNKIIEKLSPNSRFIGMSGTLRDEHTVLDDQQLKIRKELNTLLEYIPNSTLITIEDFTGNLDLEKHIKNTEVHIYPVEDVQTASIINFLTEEIKQTRSKIQDMVAETNPKQLMKLVREFYKQLPLVDVPTEIVQRLNKLLLLRKYVYSMPAFAYQKHLFRQGFSKKDFPNFPEINGKEHVTINMVKKFHKSAILCSFLSTVYSLANKLEKKGYEVFIIEGKTHNKNQVLENFKTKPDKSILLMSPVGERDIDIPQTELLIVFDLVNSPKTVYQKMKRSRGGKVVVLFYDETSERSKVRRVISQIIIRYPWSLIFFGDKPIHNREK